MKTYSVLDEARDLIDNQLAMIRELNSTKKALIESRSRFICRCGSCRWQTERVVQWLVGFAVTDLVEPVKPAIKRTRIFPLIGRNSEPS
jgi:hypothetical protein